MVISLAGRITLEEAVKAVTEVFGGWQINELPLPSLPAASFDFQPTRLTTVQASQQAIVMLGYPGAAVQQEDYAVLKLLSTYLGNGLSSRLFVELREKRGLAYDVSAFYPTRLESSQFVLYMGTAPQNTAIAMEGLRQEAERLYKVTLSAEELKSAKNKLLGQYALGKQTNAEIAQLYGWYESLGLGIEFDRTFQDAINQITPEQARSVAVKYFQHPYISLVGPEEAIALVP
jgi:predicted Zn-dependent peptidase